jgi:type I restriction enzyme S subunit
MTWSREIELGELMPQEGRSSINPADYPDEAFELLSIPAYDKGAAEIALGSEIGSTKQIVQPGDVLLSKIVPHIRRAWVVESSAGSRQIASSEWIVFRSNDADARYLRHFLLSDRFHRQFMQTVSGVGGSLLRARPKYVAKIKAPLPSLEEQRRIAAILDKASVLSINIARTIQIEDELNASIFDEIVGDPVLNPHGFPRVPLIDLCSTPGDIKCGPFGTQLKQHEFKGSGVPLWGIKHVNRRFHLATNEFLDRETAERLSTYSLLEGDIVMTRKGTVGNCCVYPNSLPPGVMHSDLLRIRLNPSKCLPEFAAYQLHHSHDVKRQIDLISGGAIMAGINVGKLKSIGILVPCIDTQKRFEALVAAALRGIWQPNAIMRRHSLTLMSSLSSRLFGRTEGSLLPQ